MPKPTKRLCAQWRQISLGICPVWSESSLWGQWVAIRTQAFFMWTSKTLIRPGGCPGWSECLLGDNAILLVLSWGGSFVFIPSVRVGAPVQPLKCYLSFVEIGRKIQFYCQFSTDGNYPMFLDTSLRSSLIGSALFIYFLYWKIASYSI